MKRHVAILALALAGGFLAPGPGAAQMDLDLRVSPRLGVMTPADYLFIEFGRFGLGPVEWTDAWIEAAPVAGIAAQLEIGDTDVWIRGEGLITIDGRTEVVWHEAQEPVGANPPALAETFFAIPTTLIVGSLDLAFPTRFTLPWGLQPYFAAGIGGKRYSFDRDAFGPTDQLPEDLTFPQDGVTWSLNIGAGTTFDVRGLGLDLQLRDAISEYWGRQQHDVMVLLGLNWRVF